MSITEIMNWVNSFISNYGVATFLIVFLFSVILVLFIYGSKEIPNILRAYSKRIQQKVGKYDINLKLHPFFATYKEKLIEIETLESESLQIEEAKNGMLKDFIKLLILNTVQEYGKLVELLENRKDAQTDEMLPDELNKLILDVQADIISKTWAKALEFKINKKIIIGFFEWDKLTKGAKKTNINLIANDDHITTKMKVHFILFSEIAYFSNIYNNIRQTAEKINGSLKDEHYEEQFENYYKSLELDEKKYIDTAEGSGKLEPLKNYEEEATKEIEPIEEVVRDVKKLSKYFKK